MLAIKFYDIFLLSLSKNQQKRTFLEILTILFQTVYRMSNFCGKKEKNHTHVKKVGHTSEFLLGILDKLEKQKPVKIKKLLK